MNIFRQWFERLRTHYNSRKIGYLVKHNKLHYGRQEVVVRNISDDPFVNDRAVNAELTPKLKATVSAKVFRAATGKWEDYGIVASTEQGNLQIHKDPR